MKKTKTIMCMIIIILVIFMININKTYAVAGFGSQIQDSMHDAGGATGEGHYTTEDNSEDPITNPDAYKPKEDAGKTTKLVNIANDLIGAMRTLGVIVAVIMLIIMGYKYMIGSVSEKADYKKSMIPYLIGAIMLFTIPTLVGIVFDLIKGINM